MWIDTHAHLDAHEFNVDRDDVVAAIKAAGVGQVVIPAVMASNFETVRELAHRYDFSYALGIHPMGVPRSTDADLETLARLLDRHRDDPRLVAIGEIGIDLFVPALKAPEQVARQEHFYREQLKLARRFDLPVLLHVRRSSDLLLKHLRRIEGVGGIAHAFNGSRQQADAFIGMGFALGFGGTVTFETSLQIRRIAAEVPLASIVMETDSPDIPPHWLYRTAGERADGEGQARNTPAELPAIGAGLAALRGLPIDALAKATGENAFRVLPRLAALHRSAESLGAAST
ncbi:MAG: DNAase [Rhizobacter sp.]|nr:DNAase [Rhizobacter sp.]